MTPHSSTLAWKIPWPEEPGRLQSMGSWRVGHDWATSLSLFTFMNWRRKWQPTPVFLPGESQGRGAWWATVYGVAQSRTRLKQLQMQQQHPLSWVTACWQMYFQTFFLSIYLDKSNNFNKCTIPWSEFSKAQWTVYGGHCFCKCIKISLILFLFLLVLSAFFKFYFFIEW